LKKINKIVGEFEGKPRQIIIKISLVIFLSSFLIGFSSGLVFREFRLYLLSARQKVQKLEEGKRLNTIFQEFSQVKSLPRK